MSKVMKTMDGNTAAAHVAYAFTDVAGIYPITPSSPMAENVDEWSAHGQKNIFGQNVKVVEMQSEAGAAGTVHGSLQAGALTTTFTASQGLLLMVPNMYKISGELLPGVFHVSARALAGHALSIFGDHSDVMATRQTGFAMLASGSVQEVMDLAGVAHLSAIKGKVPFLHFFDGFRTSHEIQKIEVIDYADLEKLVDYDAVKAFRRNALNPDHPVLRGTAQNPDIFFQAKESSNKFYDAIPAIVENYMKEISKITGREYNLFDYYGAPDATNIIIAMGSVTDTMEEAVDFMVAKGEKVGLLKVRLYRPFSIDHYLKALPSTVEKIAVLDRTKEPGSIGEPLYVDICAAYNGIEKKPFIVGGRYGLGSKDTTPEQIVAVFANLDSKAPINGFTVGINDDVTHKSIKIGEVIDTTPKGTVNCKFWGLGGDGTVGANKNSIKIIGDHTDKYAQAYFAYDSKKSGGVTVSHLRFGDKEIKSTYLISRADFVACHQHSYLGKYDIVEDVKPGGTFLLNTTWDKAEIEANFPNSVKKYIADNNISFYTINGLKIGEEIGLGQRINMVLMSAFFKLAKIVPMEEAEEYMKKAIVKSYGKKGEKIVNMNYAAVEAGKSALVKYDVPAEWSKLEASNEKEVKGTEFYKNIANVMNMQKGDSLPVSSFEGIEDGTFPQALTKFEKRGVAVNVPEWQIDNCIQCNQCSYVCPHAAIRPVLLNEEEVANAPEGFTSKKAIGKGFDKLQFRIQLSVMDCMGCGSCAEVCPSKNISLVMKHFDTQVAQAPLWEYATTVSQKETPIKKDSVKGSQFEKPYIEFTGACAGCGETPYMKLVTQLYGDRMMISNATGCSSIWGGSAPSTPFAVNEKGHGPAWANSLFEDNAEYGFGMFLGNQQVSARVEDLAKSLLDGDCDNLKEAAQKWLDNKDNGDVTRAAAEEFTASLQACKDDVKCACAADAVEEMLEKSDFMIKKSQWIVGGDGWAYDIGYGGLDHVLASGENVNVLVFDTEVYSNTGGQASKATPAGSVAKFAAAGKPIKKKDLGLMAMSYGYVYVAQCSMGYSQAQFIKAVKEAESYDGPSLIICYAPCINHGIKKGMGCAQQEEKLAVESGYWNMYRFNPSNEGNPFTLDQKDPSSDYKEFLMGEVRYASLTKSFPERAKELFKQSEQHAKDRLDTYKKLAE